MNFNDNFGGNLQIIIKRRPGRRTHTPEQCFTNFNHLRILLNADFTPLSKLSWKITSSMRPFLLALTPGCAHYTLNRFLSGNLYFLAQICVCELLEVALWASSPSTMLSTWSIRNILNEWMNEWLWRPKFVPTFISEDSPPFPAVFCISAKTFLKNTQETQAKATGPWEVGQAFVPDDNFPGCSRAHEHLHAAIQWVRVWKLVFLLHVLGHGMDDTLQCRATFPEMWCLQSVSLNVPENVQLPQVQEDSLSNTMLLRQLVLPNVTKFCQKRGGMGEVMLLRSQMLS